MNNKKELEERILIETAMTHLFRAISKEFEFNESKKVLNSTRLWDFMCDECKKIKDNRN